jgi:hypothetical protein
VGAASAGWQGGGWPVLPQARQAAWLGIWRRWREVALARGLRVLRWRALLKCFRAWAALREERKWKEQLSMRGAQLHTLGVRARRLESRAICFMQQRHAWRCLRAWLANASPQRASRLASAWGTWIEHCRDRARDRLLCQRAHDRRAGRAVLQAWRCAVRWQGQLRSQTALLA